MYLYLVTINDIEVKEKIHHEIFYVALFFKDFSCQIKRYDHIKVEEINLESFLPLVIEKLRHTEKSPFNDDIVYKHTLEECPICLENKNDFNQTICNHLFCTDCFGAIQNHRCPLCRNSL